MLPHYTEELLLCHPLHCLDGAGPAGSHPIPGDDHGVCPVDDCPRLFERGVDPVHRVVWPRGAIVGIERSHMCLGFITMRSVRFRHHGTGLHPEDSS